jgi:hypothetical protein
LLPTPTPALAPPPAMHMQFREHSWLQASSSPAAPSSGPQALSNSDILAAAPSFQQLPLEQLPRPQLRTLCQLVGVGSSGSSRALARRLQAWLAGIRADDVLIRAEGVSSLTGAELQQACRWAGAAFMHRYMLLVCCFTTWEAAAATKHTCGHVTWQRCKQAAAAAVHAQRCCIQHVRPW